MKLIDVSALKEWTENWFTKNRLYHPYAKNNNIPITELYDILEQMPSAQPEQRWIPCSERLPNLYEYTKNNGLFIVSDGNRSYSEWYNIYDKRRFGEPTMSGFRIDYAVTAWMPLPEPWRGEEHEVN